MRLTLRTLLAHLDGILDPADSEELARKVAENEFASTLAQRINDCTKRLRLGAPKVLGKGTALDPNTVAEYLDSTLAPERMPDFEKVCLESDVHLAEVAACHHILTMIVGQPAQVDAESRRRMYALASAPAEGAAAEGMAAEGMPAEGMSVESGAAGTVGLAVRAAEAAGPAADETLAADPTTSVDGFPTQPMPRPHKPQVPDYLREGARQQKMTTALIAVAAILATIAVLAFKDPLLRLVGMGSGGGETVAQSDDAASGRSNGEPSTAANSTKPANATPASPAPRTTDGPSAPAAAQPKTDDAAAAKPATANERVPPSPGEALNPADELPADTPATDAPASDTPDGPPSDEPPALPTPPADAPPTDAAKGDAPRQPDAAPRLDRAEPVGKLISADQLLLRFDTQVGDGGDWLRVQDGGMVYGGDRIVALPTFRPRLVLSGGLLVELVADSRDATIVEMLAPDAEGSPGVRVLHGRLAKISSPDKQSVPLRIAFGAKTAKVTLMGNTTTLAVSVDRPYAPGEDPMEVGDPVTATFYATSGSVDVAVDAARPVAVNEAMHLAVFPAGPAQPEPTSPPPQWLVKPEVEWLDASAATNLMRDLTPTASVGVVLAEQFHGRRIEGQSLGARSFGYLGRFDPLVKAGLKDENLSWNWREKMLGGLRQAIRRGPATAALVRDALVKEFGDRNGGVIYRMLYGYSPRDLAGGADAKLVEGLDSPDLPLRALAIFNLNSITGATLGYQPEARESQRRAWAARWRDRLQRKEIVYRDAKNAPRVANAPASIARPDETEPATGVDVGPLGETPADAPETPPAPADAKPNFPPPPPAGPDGR